ncbi:carboxymuconolactone decarboxylase family protein [Pedobacter mucosus]|uniref:carboxymuconolactone decarboxylase family protein n=1 Tax=Pedobacter mucosus TaxID=2895286 RepID=UPI001EE4E012|nr:carboxymuconolactone decarboxylase family protein [Pedobacter mucosus]UKT64702.1 carboxymuconolactone decarboxylase family protein [Pedobacter mucosus]
MKIISWQVGLLFLLSNTFISNVSAQDMSILTKQEKSLAGISATTATGNLDLLKIQLIEGLGNGLTVNEIKETLTQLYAYCGFPRSLNAINTFSAVLADRKAKNISDPEGEKIIQNTVKDKYEQGRKTLEQLSKTPQAKPAPGFGEFAPRIDAFLKEHLFADIFASKVLDFRKRELVTISALAAMEGVESQLKSHISMGRNTGITDAQLEELSVVIQKTVSTTQANTLLRNIDKPILAVIKPDMMIRISEIEIVPEHLEEYKSILKEEAAASLMKEPGVIAIYPMFQKENATQLRIVEIYADKAAYQAHLQTPHFQKYKTTTLKMVKDLKLVDMESLDKDTMKSIFRKLE